MSTPVTTWFVRIENWHPARLNTLLNAHWAERSRLKKTDAAIIALGVLGADVPKAQSPRRVSLEITLAKGERAGDPDAYWKSLLDGLVACGAIKNDSHVWCETGKVRFLRGERRGTVIRLENMAAPKGGMKEDGDTHVSPVQINANEKLVLKRQNFQL